MIKFCYKNSIQIGSKQDNDESFKKAVSVKNDWVCIFIENDSGSIRYSIYPADNIKDFDVCIEDISFDNDEGYLYDLLEQMYKLNIKIMDYHYG